MNQRILRALTVAFTSFAVAAPMAAAGVSRQPSINGTLREIGAWAAVPAKAKHAGAPRQSKLNQQLAEIGLWAVPKH